MIRPPDNLTIITSSDGHSDQLPTSWLPASNQINMTVLQTAQSKKKPLAYKEIRLTDHLEYCQMNLVTTASNQLAAMST